MVLGHNQGQKHKRMGVSTHATLKHRQGSHKALVRKSVRKHSR